jgi:hypothetical protein
MLATADVLIARDSSRLLCDADVTLANIKLAVVNDSHVTSIFVKFVMLDIVAFMLLWGMSQEDAVAVVTGKEDDPIADDLILLLTVVVERMEATNLRIKASLGDACTEAVCMQTLLLGYIEAKIAAMAARDASVGATVSSSAPPADLHAKMEEKIAVALALQRSGLAGPDRYLSLLGDMEERTLPTKPLALVDAGSPSAPRTVDQDELDLNMDELRSRLSAGETSAVGGEAYPKKRFPAAILDAIATPGGMKVVIYDGPPGQSTDFARLHMASTSEKASGVLASCTVLEVIGLDGSGMRNVLTFPCGKQCLVLCANGTSRQCHIGGGIQLYRHSGTRELVPKESIVFGTGSHDYVAEFRGMLERIAKEDDEAWAAPGGRSVLGSPAGANKPSDLLSAVLMVQNPKDLGAVFGESGITSGTVQRGASLQGTKWLFMAYIRVGGPGGRLVRCFIPKVGGSGLYGATSGYFVSAFFQAEGLGAKSPHIIFNGTAGGFANTKSGFEAAGDGVVGLGEVHPGGIILPNKSITSWGASKFTMQMRTIVPDGRALLEDMEKTSGLEAGRMAEVRRCIHFTHNHAAVMAPALETYAYIDEIVAAGNASCDVEGAATCRAVGDAVTGNVEPKATFTPIYTHSDDPRSSKGDFYDSLASMGPFFEGSRPLTALLDVVKFVFEMAVDSCD